jgi:hypothetical protein
VPAVLEREAQPDGESLARSDVRHVRGELDVDVRRRRAADALRGRRPRAQGGDRQENEGPHDPTNRAGSCGICQASAQDPSERRATVK